MISLIHKRQYLAGIFPRVWIQFFQNPGKIKLKEAASGRSELTVVSTLLNLTKMGAAGDFKYTKGGGNQKADSNQLRLVD